MAKAKLSNKTVTSKINKIGKKCKHPFICIDPCFGYHKSYRQIKLKSLVNGKTKIVLFSNIYEKSTPFEKYNKYSDENIKIRVNSAGQKTKGPKFFFVKTFLYKGGKRKIVVKNEQGILKTISYENFLVSKNTFTVNGDHCRYDFSKIEERINKINKKSPTHLQMKLLDTYCKHGDRFVTIKNIKTKEIRTVEWGSIRKLSNPFRSLSEEYIKKEVNELGLKTVGTKFCFVKITNRKTILKLIIKSLNNGKYLFVSMKALRNGYNPFSPISGQRVEVNKIQPLYEKILKKHKINYVREFNLGKKRIDFMFQINNKKYGLEIKRSDTPYYQEKQIKSYKKLGSLKQFNLSKVFLSDPKGALASKGGLSLPQFESLLIKLK